MVIEIILPILILLVIGLICRKINVLTEKRTDILNKIAFYISLPALLFGSVYSRSIQEIFSPKLTVGYFIVFFLTLGAGWLLIRNIENTPTKSTAFVQTYHGNLGYMGLPIVAMALGTAGGAAASLIVGLASISQNALTGTLMAHMNNVRASVKGRLRGMAENPILVALVAGVIFSFFNIPIPNIGGQIISLVSETALPIALLGVGASLTIESLGYKKKMLSSVAGVKLVLMPLLGWIVFWLLGIEGVGMNAGVLMLAMPSAVSTFIYSSELGGDEKLASLNISLTTLLSIITLSIILLIPM